MTAPWVPFENTNFNEGDQVAVSVSEVSSTNNQSRDLSNMGSDSMIMKTVNNDEGWEPTNSLSFPVNGMSNDSICTNRTGNLSKLGSDSTIMKATNHVDGREYMFSSSAPSSSSLSFPVNDMSNDSISAKTTVNSASYSSSLGYSNLAPQTPIKGPLGLGESQMTSRSPSGANVKHVMPVSHSHAGNNLKQPAMVTPQLRSHYYATGYEKPNIYYQEGSNHIQPNMTCSMHQYPASDYVTAFPDFIPGYSKLAPQTPIKWPLGLKERQMALSSLGYHNLAPQTPIKGPLGSGDSQMASSFPSYSNLAPQTPMKGTLCLGESQMAAASRCPSGANIKHLMPVSHSHASDSLRQSCLSSHYYENESEQPNLYLYYQDGSNQIQPDVTCSKHQSPILHPTSDNVTAFPNFLPNGLPVPYQAQSHYTQNYSSVGSTLGITSSSKFPPLIPHPASNSGNQHNVTTLPVDQNPGVQASLTIRSYPSAPFNPPLPNKLELHLKDSAGLSLPPDRSKNHANILLHTLAVHPINDPDRHVCQDTPRDIMDYPTAICTPHKERDSSETEEGQNFDLNKTPSQKTPKRRKHRPKVIREKKPPKTRKQTTPKMGPDGTKVAKRKYVRKMKASLTDTPLSVIAEEGEASNMEPASKSCRRFLNFDLENDGLDQTQRISDTNCDTVLQGMGSSKKIEDTRQLISESVSLKQQDVSTFRQPSGSVTYQSLREEESSSAPSKSSISSLLLCQDNFQNKRKKVNNGYHSNITEIECSTIHAEGPNKNQRIGHMLNNSKVDTNRGPGSGLSSSLNQCRSYSSYYCVNAQRHQMPSIVAACPGKTSASGENQSASSRTLSEHGGTESAIQAQKSSNEAFTEWTGKSTVNRTVCCSMLGTMPINQSQSTALVKKHVNTVSVEDLVELLGCLKLRATNNEIVPHNLSGLVPYKADESIVPYQKFEALKKRKARPKVDLDQETNRLWNVLMGKVITEDEKNTDEEKAKWWEEERRVFRGRADSFIARMHLVQGDRRFSPWKGSVVDSVIGVFLTQNVTDHVSSSAFMSLAAQFPFRPTKNDGTSLDDRLSVIIQEPDVSILETNGETPRHKELDKDIYARTSGRLICRDRHDLSSSSSIQHLADAKSWGLEEVISSQDSAESSNLQATGGIQSFFKSTSRDYQMKNENPYSNHNTSFNVKEVNDIVRLLDSTIQVTGNSYYEASTEGYLQFQNAMGASEKKQVDGSNIISALKASQNLFDLNFSSWQLPAISSDKGQSPLTGSSGSCSAGILEMQNLKCSISMDSSASGVTLVEDTSTTNEQIGPDLRGGTVSLQNRRVEAHYPLTHSSCAYPDMQSVEVRDVMQKQVNEALQTKVKMSRTSVSVHDYPGQTAHVDGSMMVENRVKSSSEESSRMKIYEQNSRRRDSESKRATFDWDSLRKQAQASSNQKERSKETADSMDYEALRHADVKDISQAIRERGMNNMLAERMKDFLNRVAQDHGSVDLEWLRDVPPEKAKDYLLSIRGLGLKSVECVRLLTLHQHAFPVDTNVGRIAVRLGWVPLQPLPESLQLHLLELYPVLESIQKYLWPRLCNLDQRTLYELHYQLITFGKVFCTKSKPNCNACPMRGECRHFASAFASSRLALPGPEDKSIITSDFPINATRIAPIAVNSVPLQSIEGIPYQVAKTYQGCEPIVEEPSTPEPEITETLETDIEDVYEDSDEIPTIRLNVEEFATNLQNFMQGNMELLEGDMSKALVALDPKVASIPTPRLKNVSRLRTEHQVYQLPDSHPLLKELEDREPDDPSPYLLAIWTPGETAESIQPPEGKCSSQELGRMCGENTCFTCNSIREGNTQTVRGTLLIPCRTATRGSFPLNGTYFQVNEVFADHESSLNPINVPRSWIWNLQRRTVYFGTSATTIFKGMSTEDIQYCFWRGFVCVRGFDRNLRAPRPLMARLHFPASKRGQPIQEETNNNSQA